MWYIKKSVIERGIINMNEKNETKHVCARCNKEVSGTEFNLYEGDNKKIPVCYCNECANALKNEYEEETRNVNILGALLFGLTAGVLAGFIWYWVAVLTKTYFDIIVIGIAFLIGIAVIIGAGGKKGLKLQILSAIITLITVIIAEGFMAYYFIASNKGMGLINYLLAEDTIGLIINILMIPLFGTMALGFTGFFCLLISLYVAFVVPTKNQLKLFKQNKS